MPAPADSPDDRYTLKENEPEARERLRAFWAGRSLGDRPAVLAQAPNPDCPPQPIPDADLPPKQRDWSTAWQLGGAKQMDYFHHLGEAMPYGGILFGSHLTALAVLAGGDYEYSDSAWIVEKLDVYDVDEPRFDPDHQLVRFFAETYREMANVVGRRGYLNPPVKLEAVTTLSDFRRPDQLALDLLDRPDDVKRWTRAYNRMFLDFHDYFHDLLVGLGYGEESAFLGAMAEGTMDAVQCDFAVMLSPEMFSEFVMPLLREQTDHFDFTLYHLDGVAQLRFLDQLATLPHLNGIQWNPETTQRDPTQWLDALRRMRELGLCIHIGCNVDQAETLVRELGPDGLLLNLGRFDTRDQAEHALQRIAQACHQSAR